GGLRPPACTVDLLPVDPKDRCDQAWLELKGASIAALPLPLARGTPVTPGPNGRMPSRWNFARLMARSPAAGKIADVPRSGTTRPRWSLARLMARSPAAGRIGDVPRSGTTRSTRAAGAGADD